MGPGQLQTTEWRRIATGFRQHRLLGREGVLRGSDQVVGMDIRMGHQPIDHVDVVAAVVGDIRHRALADIEIPRQPGLPGAVNAAQPEIVIAAGIEDKRGPATVFCRARLAADRSRAHAASKTARIIALNNGG